MLSVRIEDCLRDTDEEKTHAKKMPVVKGKMVIVGDIAVGKTSILGRYVSNKFNRDQRSSIVVAYSTKTCHLEDDITLKLDIWDTAGQERFQSLTSSYYRGAQAVMFVYDVPNRESFEHLNKWWREFRAYGDSRKCAIMLVGNKIDLENRCVAKEEATAWAAGYDMCYDELSSKDATNLDNVFNTLIGKLKQLPRVQKDKIEFHSKPKTDRCCY